MCVIDHSPRIETRRLTLRAPATADARRIGELAADYDICSMTTRMPWPYRPSDARGFVERTQAQDRRRDNTFAIEHEDEGVVGVIGLFTPPGEPLELGYWIGRPYWGRGFATEATLAALAWAKADWRKRLVVAGHFDDNLASGQVLIKAGFLYTGVVTPRHSAARGGLARCRMMLWLA